MASISAAARRVKDDVQSWVSEDLVRQACAATEHRWRHRLLTPWVTVQLFVQQVLWGNVACRTVTHLSPWRCTAQAYCQARMRLPMDVLGRIAALLTHAARERTRDFGRWKGHRVLHMDGTGLSMPDGPALQQTYGQPGRQKPGCGFPVREKMYGYPFSGPFFRPYSPGLGRGLCVGAAPDQSPGEPGDSAGKPAGV